MHHSISQFVFRFSSQVACMEFSIRIKTPPPLDPLSLLNTVYLSVGKTELFEISLFSHDSVPITTSGEVLSRR